MFDPPTPSSRSRRRRAAAGIGVVRFSGPDARTIARHADERRRHARAAARDADARRSARERAPIDQRHRDVLSRAALLHRRRRRRDQRARQPGAAASDRAAGDRGGRAAGRAGRVHAPGVSERAHRSRAGGSGPRSRRGGDAAQARAAFDQLEGTLTERIREIDAALFDLTARLEASLDFPGGGIPFRRARHGGRASSTAIADAIDGLLGDARRGPADPRRAAGRDRRAAQRGKSRLFNGSPARAARSSPTCPGRRAIC